MMHAAGMDQHQVVLTHYIAPSEQYEFLELPFVVPPRTEHIAVQCTAHGYAFAGEVIDLGVRDAMRSRGWSGGARSEFTIGREHATPGYLAGELHSGSWAIVVASNRLPPEGCTISVVVTCVVERGRWLKGDLHTHTVHSDGSYTLSEAIALAEEAGLDFVALTDHNTASQNAAYPRETRLVCIPGVELTTYRGHCNLLGVADPLTDVRVSTEHELRERLHTARQAGARIVLNHPHDPGCGWHYSWDIAYDWLEVWNGPWRASNQRTLDWWQTQLVAGRRLVAVGGSDTHRPHPYVKHGWPTTWVYSASRTRAGILDAIGSGHVSMSYAPTGPQIDLHCGTHMMGDSIADPEPLPLDVRVCKAAPNDLVKLVGERGVEQELRVAAAQETFAMQWSAHSRRFARVEVWRYFPQVDQTLLAALSNPIYFPNAT